MVALILFAVLILVLIVFGLFALWGTTTAATGLTIAASNLAAQTTITVLTCALVAALPLMVYGALRLGVLLGERKREREPTAPCAGVQPLIPAGDPQPRALTRGRVVVLQLPETTTTPAKGIVPRRRVRRAARSVRQAIGVARRWFT